jgi:hypothetical protein
MKSIFPSCHVSRHSLLPTLAALAALLSLIHFTDANAQNDPLPSWNDGPAKQAIIELVKATSGPSHLKRRV